MTAHHATVRPPLPRRGNRRRRLAAPLLAAAVAGASLLAVAPASHAETRTTKDAASTLMLKERTAESRSAAFKISHGWCFWYWLPGSQLDHTDPGQPVFKPCTWLVLDDGTVVPTPVP